MSAKKAPKTKRVAEKKQKTAAQSRKARGGSHHTEEAEWIVRKELDPGCTYFPLSHWGASLKGAATENYLFTVRLAYNQSMTTDGSGVYAGVFSNTPVGASNWTNYAAVFDSYRVLAIKVRFEPLWTVNYTFGPVALVCDRTDALPLTGPSLSARYSSYKRVKGNTTISESINMSGADESDFLPTSSVTANTWLKFYSYRNSATQTLGEIDVVMLVQFRGVGIN